MGSYFSQVSRMLQACKQAQVAVREQNSHNWELQSIQALKSGVPKTKSKSVKIDWENYPAAPVLLHRAAEVQLRGVPRQVLQEQLPSQTRRVAPILHAAAVIEHF